MEKEYRVDLCIIGGGMAGLAAAVSAARSGIKVLLMHDRPVLGGNASSEIRMSVGGAQGKDVRETGLLEEIALENFYRNPYRNYSIWDSILYEKARFEPNIILLLNCSCNDAKMNGDQIEYIKGWQLTTYTWHKVYAKIFADCSGDSILAPLTGAYYRYGREAENEYNESIAPKVADDKTMGLSCLMQVRDAGSKREFIPPFWANEYPKGHKIIDGHSYRKHTFDGLHTNFWWIELGGDKHTIYDTEEVKDELIKTVFGVWDHIKNKDDHHADNLELSWVGFLPGKRESIRYIGDYVMTQNDVEAEGKFDDMIAFGGWSMDDHHPDGFNYEGAPTIYHKAPVPYGIPYRCLYSKNINNLMFAGRNISVTHSALSSTRVIATCEVLGQALGTAAALAVKNHISPRDVYYQKIEELKAELLDNDAFLPWNNRKMWELSGKAVLSGDEGDISLLRNGKDRNFGNEINCWVGSKGSKLEYRFDELTKINEVRFVFDSDLNRTTCTNNSMHVTSLMNNASPLEEEELYFPQTVVKSFKIEILGKEKTYQTVFETDNNYQRLVRLKLDVEAYAIRFVASETWGCDKIHIFSWDIR